MLAAVAVAFAAFLLYHATLLPGLDFGDTPSFQVMGGEPTITPRDAYPLYFAAGAAFVRAAGDRAHGLNLASAVEAAIAAGLTTLAGVELCGAVVPAAAAALLFAVSYTFWSQAIITEVYALHALMTALSLLLLLRWERRPSRGRLAAFFAAFALGFGNHLAMVLLLPGFTVFLLVSAPGGWRSMFEWRVVALAVTIASLAAAQYAWNLHSLWLAPVAPHSLGEALSKFWFDVTKQDWRDTMVASIPRQMAAERLRMYRFDVRQQFGILGPALAALGLVRLAITARRRALLMALLYAVNVAFALSYSVGDSHVFFLPSHLMLALLAAPALAWLDESVRLNRPAWRGDWHVASAAALAVAAWTAYGNYPALDRSGDTRPIDLMTHLTSGLDDQHALLLTDLDWQAENGLNYFRREVRPDLALAYAPAVLPHADRLIADNLAAGRPVVVSGRARTDVQGAFGSRFAFTSDRPAPTLADLALGLPRGTLYVLAVLNPPRGLALDREALGRLLQLLGATSEAATLGTADYSAIAGRTGERPVFVRASNDPFRDRIRLDGTTVDIRMESWLAFDTIRRMGFGQVIAGHRHTLIIERGISFVAFAADGRSIRQGYAASLFAPEPRWAIVNP